MKRQSNRGFGLVFAGVFSVIFAIGWLVFGSVLPWTIVVTALFLIAALAWPAVLLPLNCAWNAFAHKLATVNNHIVLGLFLYLFLTPVGFIMRLTGGDPMGMSGKNRETYWRPVSRDATAETMRDLF